MYMYKINDKIKGDDTMAQATVTEQEQQQLLRRLKQKEEAALYDLIRLYGGLIRAVVRRHLDSHPQWAEDCETDVLLAVWEHIDAYQPQKSSFSNWLAAVCRYRAIDCLRHHTRELQEQELSEVLPDTHTGPEEQLLQQELSEEMEHLLQALSPQDRQLFWDYYVQQHDIQAIAQRNGVQPAALYNRLSRGRKKLRSLWPCRQK